jgi:hypothetical protein
MRKISLMLGILLAVLAHPAMAEDEGQRIARACAIDYARLCQIPLPEPKDFQDGGPVHTCLQSHIASGQLSHPCSDAIMSAPQR